MHATYLNSCRTAPLQATSLYHSGHSHFVPHCKVICNDTPLQLRHRWPSSSRLSVPKTCAPNKPAPKPPPLLPRPPLQALQAELAAARAAAADEAAARDDAAAAAQEAIEIAQRAVAGIEAERAANRRAHEKAMAEVEAYLMEREAEIQARERRLGEVRQKRKEEKKCGQGPGGRLHFWAGLGQGELLRPRLEVCLLC